MIAGLDLALAVARPAVFVVALATGVVALADWMVRTRRLNPFGAVARFVRGSVSPLLAPVERRVVRAGGLPTNAPWWALVVVVLGGIVFLSLLGFLRDQVATADFAFHSGPLGVVRLLVIWLFAILQAAIIVRVLSSMLRVSQWSPWVRWSYVISEPLLAPLRRIVPPLGMFDFTPIVAWFVLSILRWLVLGVLGR